MGSEVPFWAPYAATDLLNLKQNEGLDFGETLKLFLLPGLYPLKTTFISRKRGHG